MGVEESKEPDSRWTDPEDQDYIHGRWLEARGGPTVGTPVLASRCQKVKKDGKRCKRWSVAGMRYCTTHIGYRNLPNIQEYRDKVITQARLELLRIAPRAVNRMEKLVDDPTAPHSVQLKAATEILDRVGVRGGVELDVAVSTEEMNPSDILRQRINLLAKRSALPPGESTEDIVNAELVEEENGQEPLFVLPTTPPPAPEGL